MKFHPLELGFFAAALAGLLISSAVTSRRWAAFFAGWWIPGAGHLILGRWKKGFFFLVTLAALYVFGLWVCGFRVVSIDDDNIFYYIGQLGSGVTLYLGRIFSVENPYPLPDHPLRFEWFEAGQLYACIPGLLNLVIAINTLDRRGEPVAVAVPAPVATSADPTESAS